jgi:hypothetical protein
MGAKRCSYCDATASTRKSLTDQGWMAIVMNVGRGKSSRRFAKRACPKHVGQLNAEAVAFFRGAGE